MRLTILILAATASTAHAVCGPDEEAFMSCQIAGNKKTLQVCFDATTVTYDYGPGELVLSEPISTADFTPWGGVGREIAEGVTFQNGGYDYGVYAGFARPQSDEDHDNLDQLKFGGVRVVQNGIEVANPRCIPETVNYGAFSALYERKQALGFEWDTRARAWVPAN